MSRDIVVLNEPVKITKLGTHAALSQSPVLRPLLPHTEPLTEQSLQQCARKFRALYLKPDHLSRGQGVFRAAYAGGTWLLERSDPTGHQSWTLNDTAAVLAALPADCPYLVQQAIDLATFYGNQYDVRAAVQKDAQGRWKATGLVARLAPPRGVVTSPRSGGRVLPLWTALAHSFGRRQATKMLANIRRTARRIAAAIERHYGTCANLGIDLGVCRDGHVWLIEVNGRPLTVSLSRLNDPALTDRIHRYPIAYAASLDGVANG